MASRLILHSTQLFGASDPFVLKAIDGALWYLAQQKNCDEVDVIFHPTRNPFNIFGIMLDGARKVKHVPEKLRHLLCNSWARIQSAPKLDREYISDSDDQCLAVAEGNPDSVIVRLRYKPYPVITSFRDFILIHVKAIELFGRSFEKGRFNGALLLKTRYGPILIGDLVGSSALRLRPYGGGSLSHCKLAVLEQLVDAITFSRYINRNLLGQFEVKINSAILVREPTYLDAIYNRMLSHYGVGVIELYAYNSIYRLVNAEKYRPFSERVISRCTIKLNDDWIVNAMNYLSERIADPSRRLAYMQTGTNHEPNLLDEDQKPIKLVKGVASAAVFLHSFDDAQYVFGLDGFADLFDWTRFTIKTLLSNPKIGKVLIKSHPNVDYRNYTGDKKAMDRLKKMFPVSDKLCWVNACSGPKSFRNAGDFIGITHHGSIAEELVFLGVPVIASICAPWRDQYHFLNIWTSVEHYKALLMSDPRDLIVTEKDKLELFAYVCEARLSVNITQQDRWPWYKILDAFCIDSSGQFFDVLGRANEMLKKNHLQQDVLIKYFEAQLKKYRELAMTQ